MEGDSYMHANREEYGREEKMNEMDMTSSEKESKKGGERRKEGRNDEMKK